MLYISYFTGIKIFNKDNLEPHDFSSSGISKTKLLLQEKSISLTVIS